MLTLFSTIAKFLLSTIWKEASFFCGQRPTLNLPKGFPLGGNSTLNLNSVPKTITLFLAKKKGRILNRFNQLDYHIAVGI